MMCRTSIFALLAAAMTFAAEGDIVVNASVDSRIGTAKVTAGIQSMDLARNGSATWNAWKVNTPYTPEFTNVDAGYTAKWKVSTNNVEALSGGTNNTITIPSTSFSGCALHFYGEPNTYNVTLNQQSGSGGSSGVTATYDAPMPSATMPTRTGYTFDGYFTAANGGGTKYYNADGTSARAWNIASNATLYAKWTVNTYTVQFDQQSGSGGTASVEATYDSDMPAITLPARDGYTFGGYYTAANGGGTKYYGADGTSARTWNIGEPRTLYAKWTEAAFTVALDPQGGSGGTESVTATYGRALPSVAKPMRGGYKFNGYYAEVNGGGMQYYTSAGSATTNSLFTSDATIYAYWTLNPTVTFELNGGAFKDGSAWTTVTNYEEGVGLPSLPTGLDITYANHAFDGWYENGSTKEVKSIGPTATGDKTLSAKWVEESYWVTFVANDASGHSGELRLPMANPESLTPVSKLFSREGYSFVEWNTRSDGSGESYVDQAQITPANSLTNVPDARVILYAQWAPNPYEVAFLPNGADGGEPMPNQSFTYDVTQNLNAVEFTYTGYVFKEWSSTNHDNQTMHYTDGEAVVNLATGGVVNLYANWTGVVYTVSFNANGGEGQMEPESISCVYNMPTNLPACRFERDGWGFKGWTTNGADDVLFADRARVTNLTATAGAEVALLACWTGVTYSVTLDARDPRGDGLMVNDDGEPVSVLIGSYTVGDAWDLPTPTNGNGHLSFVGWTYEDAQGRVKDVPDKVPPPSHGITNLMASWSWVPDDFAVAVDAEELPFRTFGTAGPQGFPNEPSYDANWFVQTQFVYTDGELDCTNQTAVQSGALPEEGAEEYYATWLTTTVTGAGVLSFQWKCAARERYKTTDEFDHSNDGDSGDAFLFGRCNADGSFTEIERREGTSDGWEKVVYTNNSAEAVTFAWAFQFKSGDVGPNGEGRGGGTGWVDRVTWTPEGGGNSEPPDSGETQEMWTVTFDANGGEGAAMATQTFTNGVEQALSPNAFTRTGYTFGGWATNAMGGVVYTNCQSVAIATNTMLYASWTTNTYTVTFNANGGSEVAPITQGYGTEVTAPEDPTRTGYAFAGWTPAVPATIPASNVTCTAQWTANTYTVTFAANGGEGEMAILTNTYGVVSRLASNAFTKSGCAFAGWATNEAGAVEYADGATVSNLTDVANGSVTLYAKWTEVPPGPGPDPEPDPVVTQVTFDANGGEGEMAAQTFTNDVEQALSSNAFTRTGYTFAGWATNAAEGVVYTDGQSVTMTTNAVLYASWTPNTYTVAFDANGGEGGEMTDQVFTYDLVSCLTSNAFTKGGYTFAGWATNETGAVEYADGAEVLNLTDVVDGTVTLYAQWTEEIVPPDPESVDEIAFVESVVTADEVSNTNVIVRVSGGHAEKASSVKVYLTYNTAAAADLDLAHGSVGSVATALAFPLTLKWEAGEVGEKVITIPVKADALVEGEEFFTLQLAAASGMELGEERICTVRIADAQWPSGMNVEETAARGREALPAGATATTVKKVVDGVTNTVVTGYFTKKNSKGNVTAKAMPGYVFVAWVYTKGGKTYSTKATITDKLRKSKKVQPKFAVARYLRALADPANGGKVTGSGKCAHGKTVTLKATPTKYWSFEGWYEISEEAIVNNEEAGNSWRLRSKSKSWKVKATNDVTYVAMFKPYPKVKLTVDKEFSGGTVKGAGSYLTGKKVTLKATPKKGYAFTGWWRVAVDAEGVCTTNRVSLSASYAYTVKADGVALVARFKKETALVRPTLTWGDYVVGGNALDVHSTNLTVGVSYSAKLTVAGESAVSITKVTGLPTGLTYKSGKVSGVPTVKKVYTAKVTVALKSNAKKTWTYSVKLNVAALPAWAVGTFKGKLYDGEGEGAAAKGTVTLTVGKTGKISGKFVNLKKTAYTFTSSSFKTYGDDGVLRTKATMKYGTKSVTLDIAVGSEEMVGEDGSTTVGGIAEVDSAAAPFNGGAAQLVK